MTYKLARYLLCFTIVGLTACAVSTQHTNSLVQRLSNRGVVPLSSENPYLAANLLLTRETERSQELKGFVEHRGQPTAIEVKKELFASLFLILYYSDRKEYYTAEDIDGVWVVRGPDATPEAISKELSTMALPHGLEPAKVIMPVRQEVSGIKPQPAPSAASSLPTPSPTFATATQGVEAVSSNSKDRIKVIIDETPNIEASLNSKGDIIHTVTYSGETLSLLARWYTLDRDNAGRLARINKLSDPNELSLGDTVLIPRYLVRNSRKLSDGALRELHKLAAEESQLQRNY